MASNVCPQCGAPNKMGVSNCKYCGESLAVTIQPKQQSQEVQPEYRQAQAVAQPQNYQQQNYQQPQQYVQQPQYNQQPQQYVQQPQYNQPQGYNQPAPIAYQQPQQVYVQQPQQATYSTYVEPQRPVIDPHWPIKSKGVAAFLAIFFGTLGFHKFYLGSIGWGILYILFSWTLVPTVLGVIEGIIYLGSNNHNFMMKHHVQLKNQIQ